MKSGNLTGNDDPGADGFGDPAITEVTYDGGLGDADRSEDATTITFTAASWTLVIDKASGAYTFTQTDALDHEAVQGSNDALGTFSYTVQDLDGSTSSSQLTITITDDVVVAVDDHGGVVDEGAATSGNLLANDDSGVDGFAEVTEVEHDGFVYTAEDGVIAFATARGGTFTLEVATGEYTYDAPALDDLDADATETFTYTVLDGDGDSDSAALTIDVDDVIEPAGAFLLTNTNVEKQILRIIVTRDDAEILASEESARGGEGQQGAVPLGEGVLFEETESYAVIVKFVQDGGTTNVTDFDLIFDLEAADLDDPDNVFLTLLDQGNVHLGEQGGSHDGVIWQVEGTGEGFAISPAIVYDVEPTGIGGGRRGGGFRQRRSARKLRARLRPFAHRRRRDAQ